MVSVVALGGAFALAYWAVQPGDRRAKPPLVVKRPKQSGSANAAQSGLKSPTLAQVIEAIEPGIVRIESLGGGRASLGSGFVVDEEEGLVATCYHVIAEATEAVVRLRDGSSYRIEGYAAIDTNDDLAVLKVPHLPSTAQALSFRDEPDPQQLSTVIAIGHPRGLAFSPFDGKVSRVLTTAQLPEQSKRFVSRTITSDRDHRWVQHTAQLSGGNSGGPLIDTLGRVIGVNTWTDRESGFGYALHAKHLTNLLARPLIQVAPLDDYAQTDARVHTFLRKLTASQIDELYRRAEATGWHPQSREDYQVLQDLAWAITAAHFPGTLEAPGMLDAEQLEPAIRAADKVVERLRKNSWDGPAQVTLINELAAPRIGRPGNGLFVFASVNRVVAGRDGSRGALLRVAGFDRMIFVRIDTLLIHLEPGMQCLVLGVNDQGRVVRFGNNPLDLTVAPVVTSRTILPLTP